MKGTAGGGKQKSAEVPDKKLKPSVGQVTVQAITPTLIHCYTSSFAVLVYVRVKYPAIWRSLSLFLHSHMYAHTHAYTHTHSLTPTHPPTPTHTLTHTYTCTHTHSHTHAHAYTHCTCTTYCAFTCSHTKTSIHAWQCIHNPNPHKIQSLFQLSHSDNTLPSTEAHPCQPESAVSVTTS